MQSDPSLDRTDDGHLRALREEAENYLTHEPDRFKGSW